jgi:hypothetical protein
MRNVGNRLSIERNKKCELLKFSCQNLGFRQKQVVNTQLCEILSNWATFLKGKAVAVPAPHHKDIREVKVKLHALTLQLDEGKWSVWLSDGDGTIDEPDREDNVKTDLREEVCTGLDNLAQM